MTHGAYVARSCLALIVASLFGCASAPGRATSNSPGVRLVQITKDRAALFARPSDQVGAVRALLVEAGRNGAMFVELHDTTHVAVVELPQTRALDDVATVVVVRIDAAGRYGTQTVSDTHALEAVARRDANTATVALLRAADDISLEQIIGAAAALTRAGIAHVVLGLQPAGVAPPPDGWDSCAFPDGAEDQNGTAVLAIDWDEQARPGIIRVVKSEGRGFGGAAVLCALWQRSSTSRCSGTPPCTQNLRVRFQR